MSPLLPPSVDFLTGTINDCGLVSKATRLRDLQGVFADQNAYAGSEADKIIYQVEMLPPQTADGELNFGVTHLEAGSVGDEFYMTRGHFHERKEQAEFYFGCRGTGLLLLQDEAGICRAESVFPGSIHHIPAFTAHRLVNTGSEKLSALAVWPAVAGHNYNDLEFALSVHQQGQGMVLKQKCSNEE